MHENVQEPGSEADARTAIKRSASGDEARTFQSSSSSFVLDQRHVSSNTRQFNADDDVIASRLASERYGPGGRILPYVFVPRYAPVP